jgi:hypothetical protein
MEKLNEVPIRPGPVQGVQVGDRVHYTHADVAGGKFLPSKPRSAMVIEVDEFTGKPTLLVWSTQAGAQGMPGVAANSPGQPVVVLCMCVVDVEFSPEPAGSMAARGCWSWPPPRSVKTEPQAEG